MKKPYLKTCAAYLAAMWMLSACGGGDSSDGSASSSSATTPAPTTRAATITTVAQAFDRAEVQGMTPVLDRSAVVTGADAYRNGVRDDVDAYIASFPATPEQKKALAQFSASLSLALTVDVTDRTALQGVSAKMSDAVTCIYSRYPTSREASQARRAIQKYTVNTKERFLAYDKFNQAMNGTSSLSPIGNGCAN